MVIHCPVLAQLLLLMDAFHPVTPDDVRRVIMASPSQSSSLDPIPTFLLKEVLDTLPPFIIAMVNASLQQGRLPMTQKQATVTPQLKRPGWTRQTSPITDPGPPFLSLEDSGTSCC